MKISEAYKAVTAGATALAGMEGLAAMIEGSATQPWVHAAAVGFSLLVSGATWFVRNKATFDQIEKAFEDDAEITEKVIEKVTNDPATAQAATQAVVEKHPTLAEQIVAEAAAK
jgi:hypothetical protein